jgi:hypothetical protein
VLGEVHHARSDYALFFRDFIFSFF